MSNFKSDKSNGCEVKISPDTLHAKPSPLLTIMVADTEFKCVEAIKKILSDCSESGYRVVGLDAEWNHQHGMRAHGSKIGKVSIVSICSPRGYCALFRMSKLRKIPVFLKDFLMDTTVAKVGTGIRMVTTHLFTDFKVQTERYADLQEIAIRQNIARPLAKKIFDIYVCRDERRFDHSEWVTKELLPQYIEFATKIVYASIEIHKEIVPTSLVTDFD